jgi:hypothetical protein
MNAFRALVEAIQTLPNNSSSLKPQLIATVNAMRRLKAAKAANPNAAAKLAAANVPATPTKKSFIAGAVNKLTAWGARLTPKRVNGEGNKVAAALAFVKKLRADARQRYSSWEAARAAAKARVAANANAKAPANAKAAANAKAVESRIAQIRKLNTDFKKAKTTVQKIALANAMNSLMGANINNMNIRTIVTNVRNAADAARKANETAVVALAQKRINDKYKKFIQEVWPRTVGRGMGNAWRVKKEFVPADLTPIITKYFNKNSLTTNNKQKIKNFIPNNPVSGSIIGWQGLLRRPDANYNKRKNYLKKIFNINQTP